MTESMHHLLNENSCREMFDYQDGEIIYVGLMDSASGEDFDRILPNLKRKWDEIDMVF